MGFDRDRSEMANRRESATEATEDKRKRTTGPGEVYCTNCGRKIKAAAEVCPHCSARQTDVAARSRALSERRQYELEHIANKSRISGAILGLLAPPVSYVYVDKWGWALLNLLTLNYLFLGFIVVPLHIMNIISDAKGQLRDAGVGGY